MADEKFIKVLKNVEKAIKKREKNMTKKELKIILEEVKANIEDHTAEKYKELIKELTNALKEEDTETALFIVNKIENMIDDEYTSKKKRSSGDYYIG